MAAVSTTREWSAGQGSESEQNAAMREIITEMTRQIKQLAFQNAALQRQNSDLISRQNELLATIKETQEKYQQRFVALERTVSNLQNRTSKNKILTAICSSVVCFVTGFFAHSLLS